MLTFCTVSTNSHLFKSYALADSIEKFGAKLYVLITDDINKSGIIDKPENVELVSLSKIQNEHSEKVVDKYNGDKLRWALKPFFLSYLLNRNEKVVYVDNDIYFYNDFNFLEKELDENNVLLTPHFYPSDPKENQTWLESNFRIGLFNAGFIAVNQRAKEAMQWWSECTLYEMKRSYSRGLFDDQKYLDLFPVLFEGVKILKHRGCNLAGWNDYNKLEENKVIFIHFNSYTLNKFKVNSNYYFSYYKIYLSALQEYFPKFEVKKIKFDRLKIQNAVYFVNWKISRLMNLK